MKYTDEFLEKLKLAVYEEAEQLASEVDCDGLTNHEMFVEAGEEIFVFIVDCMISNFDYDHDTNAASYNVGVFCTRTPNHNNKNLRIFMIQEFYLETLYKD